LFTTALFFLTSASASIMLSLLLIFSATSSLLKKPAIYAGTEVNSGTAFHISLSSSALRQPPS
jgi:hypothetical protein